MKRLVSFSLASMLAMGMTAGAAVQPASANMKGWISSSEVQGMNKDEILQYLFEKFDISIGNDSPVQKPGTGGGSSQNPGSGSGGGSSETPDSGSGGGSSQNPGSGSGSGSSQTSYAAQVVSLVNAERAKYGLSALTMDSSVTAAAQVRAGELYQSFSHTRPDGRSCFTALREAGASYSGAGENIAYGQRSPEAVMQAWMNSSGHRANILSNKYTKIGVGYTVKNGVTYWTQMFTY
ncbi:CAP domain-containing protein [Intestinibacillus sp. Marseille-P6563]|uniref:CAP domain-containing protein n=1 Tax=Intestinibacillus sp. Marseille-P6563 TaxID=2364792 RepID=UPI0019CF6280|nr:CAP domain-containing protein [Intestinibacillus sp. Marseille-P6563]